MTRRIIALSLTLSLPLAMLACDGDDETGTSTGTTTGTTTTDTTTDTGTGGGGGGGGGSAGLEIEMYTSDPMGPAVNSVLITGAEDAVLVDGQFWLADAEAVIQMVQDSQKTLRTIFLTHPHPDHYLKAEADPGRLPRGADRGDPGGGRGLQCLRAGHLRLLEGAAGRQHRRRDCGGAGAGKRVKAEAVADTLARLAKRAKVPNVHTHDGRRTVATYLLDVAGVKPHVVQGMLGHVSIDQTMKYRRGESRRAQEEAAELLPVPFS